jgi:hypothetical protein
MFRLPTGCQQRVRHTKVTSVRSSFHDDSNKWSQPILLTIGEHFVFFVILQTFARLGCQQVVSNKLDTKVISLRSSFHDDSNDWSQPILSTNGEHFVFFVILQTFARFRCRQAVSNGLDTQKSHNCNPHFMTILYF